MSPRSLAFTVIAAAAIVLFVPAMAPAQHSEVIHRYDVEIEIEADGTLLISETIRYDFGSSERHGIYRDIPDRLEYDDEHDRLYPIDVVSVTASAGTPSAYMVVREGGLFRIRVGDPDRTISGAHTYVLTYRVDGVLNAFPDHDELYWNAIGDQWDATIERARVTVTAPGAIERVACFAGPTGSTLPCKTAEVDGGSATFEHRDLSAHEAFTVVVGLPKGVVPEPPPILDDRWSVGRAFSITPASVGGFVVLLIAAVGGFGVLAWRTGRDRRVVGSPVDIVMGAPDGTSERPVPLFESGGAPVEFAPPAGLRPGQIGTLVDEVANPLDVTATIVDLAVRGHLTIVEIPKSGWFGKPDWMLARKDQADASLLEYERRLLEGLFEGGPEVELSSLKTTFVTRLHTVQEALYDDAVSSGWFVGRPDRIRQRWIGIGVGALVVAGAIEFAAIRWTEYGLVGVPLLLFGLLVLTGARWMPRRTAKGTGLARRVSGFRTVIATAEAHLARWAEQENVFTRFLPYAIVFGLTEKWAKAFEGLARQPDTSWYVSSRPFAYAGFAEAMNGFSVTTVGTIASTPSGSGGTGFGGGGFAGGGGGGGGGGSW
jgi:uncharacterized membrane protein YgcG